MVIYSISKKREIFTNVNDVLFALRAQGFYSLPAAKNNEYTPDINVLAKSIYELIQHSSPEVKALIGEVLKLTPQTASQEQILRIHEEIMQRIMQTVTRKQFNDNKFQVHLPVLGAYFDTMIACCER